MILATTITPSAILVIAMAVVLLLMVGVVAAMRQPALAPGKPAKGAPAPIPPDVSNIDLEERLRVIVLPPKPTLATAPHTANFQTRSLDRSIGARVQTGPIMIQPPRPEEITTLLGPRSALPGPVIAPRPSSPARPSAASTSGLPALPSSSTQPSVVIMPPTTPQRPAPAPPQAASGARQPAAPAKKMPKVEMVPQIEPRVLPPDVELPGTRGFTMISDETETYNQSTQPALFNGATGETRSQSPALPPIPVEEVSTDWPGSGKDRSPQAEYEGMPALPFSVDGKTNGSVSSEAPAAFAVASSLADDDAAPMGAVPFSPDLLKLRVPASALLDAETLANALGTALSDEYQPSGASSLDAAGHSRTQSPSVAPAPPPLAAEGDGLSETHVFATSDLYPTQIEEVEASIEQMPVMQGFPESAPPWVVAPPPAAKDVALQPAGNRLSSLAPDQAAQARQLLQELASLPDIGFVKLLGSDGTVIVSAAKETAHSAVDEHIAVLIGFAIMEVKQLGLGEWTSMAVEAPGLALLLSPLSGGASLAILLSNPTRLALLRRQLRKPLSGLQEVLSGARVS